MAPLYEQKCKLWASARLDPTSTISLTLNDPLPRTVLGYLRIQRSDESDLAAIALQRIDPTREKISDANEVEILRFLIESFGGLLDGFGIQLEKLEELLAQGEYPAGGNAWAAAHVSLGEQRVLSLARKRAEDMLAAVESGRGSGYGKGSSSSASVSVSGSSSSASAAARCANCGKDSVPLMACARCKAVMYCGRACQLAHYKEHKAKCREYSS